MRQGLAGEALALLADTSYGNYPHACLPGLYGDSVDDQKSAFCSGQCPARFTCGSYATIEPTPCRIGGYCPEGSYAAQPCTAGRFGNETGLSSADECHACPLGAACGTGATAPMECSPGTFASEAGSIVCEACPVRPQCKSFPVVRSGVTRHLAAPVSCPLDCSVGAAEIPPAPRIHNSIVLLVCCASQSPRRVAQHPSAF